MANGEWQEPDRSAWDQVATDEKSNEITAIPELLKLLDICGAIITIDTRGTQRAIAAEIIDQQADHVLALKGNQETWESWCHLSVNSGPPHRNDRLGQRKSKREQEAYWIAIDEPVLGPASPAVFQCRWFF